MRSGDEGTRHADGFAKALNAMLKFLDNELYSHKGSEASYIVARQRIIEVAHRSSDRYFIRISTAAS